MKTLVLVEHDGQRVTHATLSTVTAAARLGTVDLLVAGENVAPIAEQAATIAGVEQVRLVNDARYRHFLPEALAPLIVGLMVDYGAFLAPATAMGKNVTPRVAALLDVMQVSDILSVEGPDTFTRPIYAGNAIATVRSTDHKKVLTVRATAFDKAEAAGGAASILPAETAVAQSQATFVRADLSVSERPELTSAPIVVAGGRAVGSEQGFRDLIAPLADKLGAAIGASRAAVDAGYAPNDQQVGQTGKIVAPDLYLAIGISGAIQHLAGMKGAKTIVAINSDPEAPIFQVADLGLVADLHAAVPTLIEAL